MMNSGYSLADIAAATGGSNNRGCNDGYGWGGEWFLWMIVILAMFNGGWGGFGFGSNGGANGSGFQGWATRADINEGFALNNIQNGITGITQGICDSTYNIVNSMNSGFSSAELQRCQQQAALMQQLNTMSYQNQQCCCDTQGAIKDTRYDIATMGNNVVQSAHNDTDRIIARLDAMESTRQQEKIHALELENQKLSFQASQSNQNAVLQAAMDANTAEIIRRTGNDCPIPAYVVPNPNCCYGNPLGVGYYGNNCNGGCGYNSACC